MAENGQPRDKGKTDDAPREIPNLEVITVRPPTTGDGDAYSAETVIRAVPTELLREFHASLKPQKLPSFQTERSHDEAPANLEKVDGTPPATPKSAPPLPVASEPAFTEAPEAPAPPSAPPSEGLSGALVVGADLELEPPPDRSVGDRSVFIALVLTMLVVLALVAAIYITR